MQRTTLKVTVYLIAVLSAHYVDVVFESFIQFVYVVAGVMC
jgi:hypothetical protein